MRLIFIHGPAGVGKLTVARELAALTGLRLFHNHLVVDAVGAVFEFGSEPFVRLREQVWLAVFGEAARRGVSLIFTFAPERTVSPSFVENAVDTVHSAGGEVLFVRLTCSEEELERRIGDTSRAEFGKLQSAALYRELARAGAFEYPELPSAGLTLDTGALGSREAAARIAEYFSLGRQQSDRPGAPRPT